MPEGSRQTKDVFDVPVEEIEEHPGHRDIPNLSQQDFESLVESIRQNGVMDEVELLSREDAEARGQGENAGKLVDGCQRLRAARECGLETIPATYATIPEGMSVVEYIARKAAERRQMNKSQKAILAVGLKRRLEKEAGQGARTDLREQIPEVEGERSRERAGSIFGVSGRYITTAEKLLDHAPDLAEEVRKGEKTLTQAIREYNRREGRTGTASAFGKTRTMFKRFRSSFNKVRPSNQLPKEQYDEAKELLARLEELFEQAGEKEERPGDEQ